MRAFYINSTLARDPKPLSDLTIPDTMHPRQVKFNLGIAACGLNFADLLMLEGRSIRTPHQHRSRSAWKWPASVKALGPETEAPARRDDALPFSAVRAVWQTTGVFPRIARSRIPETDEFHRRRSGVPDCLWHQPRGA